jgi:DNA transformation protein and related proteins
MFASAEFASSLEGQLAPLGYITTRRMFGKTGVFCEGVMFAMVNDDIVYFRVDDQNRATFAESESFPSLNYFKNGQTIDLSFWRAPDRLFDEDKENDELIDWSRAALAAAHRVAVKRGKKRKSSRSTFVAK